jgi:hypothetical protein
MATFLRSVIDGICGAAVLCVIAVGVIAIVMLPGVLPDTSEGKVYLRQLPYTLRTAAIGGLVLGSLTGFSARMTNGRVSFLRCLLLIGGPAGVVRIVTNPQHKEFAVSDIATVTAAIAAATLILLWNYLKMRGDASSESSP